MHTRSGSRTNNDLNQTEVTELLAKEGSAIILFTSSWMIATHRQLKYAPKKHIDMYVCVF